MLSLNVRGLRNPNKRRAVFCYLKQQKATIFCLQGPFSQPDDEQVKNVLQNGAAKYFLNMELPIQKTYVRPCNIIAS